MKSIQRARKISIVLSMGVVYPFVLLADALGWPPVVEFALGVLALIALVGPVLLLTDWKTWRADRVRLRDERAVRKAVRSNTRRDT